MQKHRADTISAVQPTVPDPPTNLPLNVTGISSKLLAEDVVSITEKLPEQLISDIVRKPNLFPAFDYANKFEKTED